MRLRHLALRLITLLVAPLAMSASPAETSAYLFAHFTGETPTGEQIHFAVSEDGLKWTDLNGSAPVLVSELGEKGVRDPALVRSPDGKKFFLLATDLRIASDKGWGHATSHGSTQLVVWESPDLVSWSAPWLANIAGAIPDAGCAWAPEALFDHATGDYFVYWSTISPRDGDRKARVYCSRTKDFRTFSAPELYIARPGRDIIDTQIIEVAGAKHRYYRVSCDGQITVEAGDSLQGEWTRTGDLSYLGYTGKHLEGPIIFKFNREPRWCLMLDQYSSRRGYLPFLTTDFDDAKGFSVAPSGEYSLGASLKRHGGILAITRAELDALRAKWPTRP